jgi:hypothetical protein
MNPKSRMGKLKASGRLRAVITAGGPNACLSALRDSPGVLCHASRIQSAQIKNPNPRQTGCNRPAHTKFEARTCGSADIARVPGQYPHASSGCTE